MSVNHLQRLAPVRQRLSLIDISSLSFVLLSIAIVTVMLRQSIQSTGQELFKDAGGTHMAMPPMLRSFDLPMLRHQNPPQTGVTNQQQLALSYTSNTPEHINEGKSAWLASNPGAHLTAYFFENEVVIAPSNTRDPWQFKMHFVELVAAGKILSADKAITKVDNNKIEYQRGIITEWFINDSIGIEHGFVIQDDVMFHQQNSLTLAVAFDGLNNTQGQVLNERNVALKSKLNGGWLNYSKLMAVDNAGKQLPAEFAVNGNQISITININAAQFPVTVDPLITSNWFQVGGINVGESFGLRVSSVGDVTGNGYDDVLVADPKAEEKINDDISYNRGTVSLFEGSASGLNISPVWSYTETELSAYTTPVYGALFGYFIGPAGDVNGDGYKDFIVTAPTYTNPISNIDLEGRVYIFFGASGGVSSVLPFTVTSGTTLGGTNYGNSAAMVDVNGDGLKDLIVGHPNYGNPITADPLTNNADEGRIVVYFKNASFDPLIPETLFDTNTPLSYESNKSPWGFGNSVANVGDVNGDGLDDILIGVPGYFNPQDTEGAVFLYHGVPAGSVVDFSQPDWQYESNQIGARLGAIVAAAGNINNDAYTDIIISSYLWDATMANQGIAYVFLGPLAKLAPGDPPAVPDWSYNGATANANLNAVASAGDVNGDGFGDVIVGVPFFANGQIDEGQALVFEGSASGLSATPSWNYESNKVDDAAGFSVSGGGDFNGDGYSDIIVGAPGVDNPPTVINKGAVYAFLGAGNSDLEVVVTDSVDPVPPGIDFTYTIQVANNGPDPAKKVVLTHTLPTGTVFQVLNAGAGWSCAYLVPDVTCTQSNINVGQATPVAVTVYYPTTAAAITASTSVTANIIDSNTSNNTVNESTQINTPPIANVTAVSTDEDVSYVANQPAQYLPGSDPDQDPLTFSLATPAGKGIAIVSVNGAFSYQPNANYNGLDSFAYGVSDGIASATAIVNITINAVNDAPVTANSAFTTNEDTAYNDTLTASDIDNPVNQLSFSLNQIPQQGSVIINTDGSYTYTPNANVNGNDSFGFAVSDNGVPAGTATGTMSVTILAVNDAPVANNQSITVLEDTPANGQLSATDVETPNQLTYSALAGAGPTQGSVVVLPDGSFTYTSTLNATGQDSFGFKVTDVGTPALSATATVTITISATNDPPVAQSLIVTTDEDTPLNDQLLASDLETPVDQLLFTLEVNPTHGKVLVQNSGAFTYTPNKDYAGTDSFVFKVQDNSVPSNSDTATVSITINPINDAPIALNGNINIIQGQTWGGFLLGKDAENTPLQYALLDAPAKGTVEIYDINTGGYTYTPDANATGSDSFTFTVTDGELTSDATTPGQVSVFINGAGSGNVSPSIPTLIGPDNGVNDVDGSKAELSWQAAIDPNGDSLGYRVVLCADDPAATCAPVTANNQQAALSYRMIALGGSGSGLILLGLLGVNRRKQWQQALIVIAVIVLLNACSNAAEEAQKSTTPTFTKGTPIVLTHLATNLTPVTTYYWKILVDDGSGGSAQSAIRSFVTKP